MMSEAAVLGLVKDLLSKNRGVARLSEFFLPLDKAFDRLRPFQKKGIRYILSGRSFICVDKTGSGKTLLGLVGLWVALSRGKIGTYLVPHVRLLAQKAGQIRAFFGPSVHVVELKGESKPPLRILRKHVKRLIIVATFEAFRSFLFDVQGRQYFTSTDVFGTVVVDEAHVIGEKGRGPALETLLYKLQDEFRVQTCLLSASFNEESARKWGNRLEAEVLWNDPNREFRFFIRRDDGTRGATESTALEEACEDFFTECGVYSEGGFVKTGKMLIFCHSRNDAERESARIRFSVQEWFEERNVDFYCKHIHAGLERDQQDSIFREFEQHQGIAIICCTSLLETGIDVPHVSRVIIKNAGGYSGVKLAQMLGRSREKIPDVIFLVRPDKEKSLLDKLVLEDDARKELELSLRLRRDIHGMARGVRLDPITSQIDLECVHRLVLEQLYRSQTTRKKLVTRFQKLLTEDQFASYNASIMVFLREAMERDLVRRGGKKSGMLGLTYIGEAMVESGLDVESGKKIISFFREHPVPTSKELRILLAEIGSSLLMKSVIEEERADDDEFLKRKKKREEKTRAYLKHRQRSHEKNLKLEKQLGILSGDVETYRKQGIWLASAMYLLFRGLKLHQQASHSDLPYLEVASRAASVTKDHLKTFRCLQRVIRRFQKEPSESPWKKPAHRPRKHRPRKSRYRPIIYFILSYRKEQGATVKEIFDEIKKYEGKRASRLLPPLKEQSIRTQLRGPLAPLVRISRIYSSKQGRVRFRYFLKEYYKPEANACRECRFFVQRKKSCKRTGTARSPRTIACSGFERKIRKFISFQEFEVSKQGVKCPACGRIGTIGVPSFKEMVICNKCNVLIKQVRQGWYRGKVNVEVPKERIVLRDGIKYVPIDATARLIFLEEGEALSIKKKEGTGVSLLIISGKRNYEYFQDEVWKVLVAGGRISASVRDFLTENGIELEYFSEEVVIQLKRRDKEAVRLRSSLENLDGDPRLLELARKTILAKIKSNIFYTHELKKTWYSPDDLDDLILRQFDQVVKSFLSPFSIIHLRSLEGNAEIPAWNAQKASLPKEFQFKGRQTGRYSRSYLIADVKACDPYNTALNYLYRLLEKLAASALARVGFHRYYPGPGILHARTRTQKKAGVKSKKNRELIYDFMDTYRPPFRHYLGGAFRDGILRNAHFKKYRDEWGQTIYTITEHGKMELERLFQHVCSRHFYFEKKSGTLVDAMNAEAQDLANFVQTGDITGYTPFSAFEDDESRHAINYIFDVFESVLGNKARKRLKIRALEKNTQEQASEKSVTGHPRNVIIVAHSDFDGFGSVLLLTSCHHPDENLTIFFASNEPSSYQYIFNVLRRDVRESLLQGATNILHVADFQVDVSNVVERNAFMSMVDGLKKQVDDLEINWFDHHESTSKARTYLEELGIRVHHDSSKMHAFQIIKEHFLECMQVTFFLLPFQLKKAAKSSEKMNHVKLFLELSTTPTLVLRSNPDFIDLWFEKFEFYLQNRSRINWTYFFRRACRRGTPRLTKQQLKARKKDLTDSLSYHVFAITAKQDVFAALLFKKEFSINKIEHLLRQLSPRSSMVKKLFKEGSLPVFVLCYWSNHTITLKALDPAINFSGIIERPERGFTGRVRIFYPTWRVLQFEGLDIEPQWGYSFLPIDLFIRELTRRELSGQPEPLISPRLQKILLFRDEKKKDGAPRTREIDETFLEGVLNDLNDARDPIFGSLDSLREHLRQRFRGTMSSKIVDVEQAVQDIIEQNAKFGLSRASLEKIVITHFKDAPKIDEQENESTVSRIFKHASESREYFPLFLPGLDQRLSKLPLGKVLLFYSHWTEQDRLFHFLNYVMLVAQSQRGLNSSHVLYIDRNPPRFGNLIGLTSTLPEFSLQDVENIIYLKYEDEHQLGDIIDHHLPAILDVLNVRLIIVNALFERSLYWTSWDEDFKENAFYRSERSSSFLVQLGNLARARKRCIMITHLEPQKRRVREKMPSIPVNAMTLFYWTVSVESIKGRQKTAVIRTCFKGKDIEPTENEVKLPSWQRKPRAKKHYCSFLAKTSRSS